MRSDPYRITPLPQNRTRFSSYNSIAASAMAAADHRVRLWWRRRGGAGKVGVAFVASVLLAVAFLTASRWTIGPITFTTGPALVELTLVKSAKEKGALCLDGSLPGYHLQRGFGSGSESWLLHIEGGGWCHDVQTCSRRKKTELGSSNYMESQVAFVGILSNDKSLNPDFFNWNKVKIRYCDGASFSGNVNDELQNGTSFFFRGQRIWETIMTELLLEGLASAKQAFLTGCSAGGLSTYIHCDDFRALLPKESTVKCLADAGFFLDVEDISGRRTIREFYSDVTRLQDLSNRLPNCNSRMEAGQCFFPREIVKSIKTPLFILNPAYDTWQVQYVLAPLATDPFQTWQNCRLDISKCDSSQIKILQGFRKALLDALSEAKQKEDWGMFINSCFVHCQSMKTDTWHTPFSPRINNKTIAEAVGDWYFDRRVVKEIDCEHPCNPTCYNLVMSKPFKSD